MKKRKKGISIIWVLVLIIAIIIVIKIVNKKDTNSENQIPENNIINEKYVQVLVDGTKLNKSNKLSETKTVGNYKINNMQLTMKNNQSVILADIKNTSKEQTNTAFIDIILYDENENKIATIPGIISPMKPGETTQLNSSITVDCANAYDFEIIIKQ